MNSTAIRRRTEPSALAFTLDANAIRSLLAFALMTIVWVSFTPFPAVSVAPGADGSGNAFNQIGYTVACGLAVAGMAMLTDRRMLLALYGPGWLLMLVLVGLSALPALDPGSAARSVAFSIMAVLMASSVVALTPSAKSFSRVLLAACLVVLVLSYGGIVLLPQRALHQGAEVAEQAGLWRGLFSHKNIAGPVMAAIVFSGLYLMRRGMRVTGGLVALAALVFVWKTGSKTTVALVPAIILLVMLPAMAGMRRMAVAGVLVAILVIHALTIGTVFVPLFDHILRAVDPTTTFTGRTQIWEFARDFVTRHPWTGFGYDSFWSTPVAAAGEQPFDRGWDPRGIIHGHNGFLDVTLFMGFPALFVAIWVLVLAPLRDYLRTPVWRENVLMADLFMMIVAFVMMNAALESFMFRRSDPVWLTLVVALFGLRVVSFRRIRSD